MKPQTLIDPPCPLTLLRKVGYEGLLCFTMLANDDWVTQIGYSKGYANGLLKRLRQWVTQKVTQIGYSNGSLNVDLGSKWRLVFNDRAFDRGLGESGGMCPEAGFEVGGVVV